MADTVNFVAGGTVQAGGGVYIPRQADQELLALCRSGAFAYVLTPRQMGKSSLMVQTADALQQQHIRTATIDLSTIGTTNLDVEAWYLGLLTTICRQLGLVRQLMTWWRAHKELGPTQRFTQFFEEVVLVEISERIVIFIDEIDTTLNLDFTDDFFIAIRSFYLARASDPNFVRLSFVLFGVATPSDLIRNPQRTPFNIGQRVDLTDFNLSEASPLAHGFNLPKAEAQQVLHWVLAWTGGHPYLTQRLCQTLTEDSHTQWTEAGVADVVERIFLGSASKQDTNLQFVRDMLTLRSPDLTAGLTTYCEVLRNQQPVLDEEQSLTKAHLKLSGIVKCENGLLHVRNPIYQEVFDLYWVREHLPINWAKRLRRAAVAAGIIFLAATAPLGVFAEMQRRVVVEQRDDLETALNDAELAREEAENARMSEAAQREKAEAGEATAAKAWQKAEDERDIAKKAQKEAITAQKQEAEQRLQAETAQKSEAQQRLRAENALDAEAVQRQAAELARQAETEQRLIAEEAKAEAERAADEARLTRDIALLQEKSIRAESRLSSPRAVEGLILAMHSVIESRKLPEDAKNSSDILSVVESSLLRASEEAKEKMVINPRDRASSNVVALSPNDQKIAIGMENGQIRLLDVQGNPIRVFGDLGTSIVGIAFSADGQKIVSIDKNGVVKRWQSDGEPIDATEEHTTFNVIAASFSDDTQTVAATLTDGSIAVQRLPGSGWKEWLVDDNEPEVREVAARFEAGDETDAGFLPAPTPVESDFQRFDTYEIQGQAGQMIEVTMESNDFGADLILENSFEEVLVTNYFTEGQKTVLRAVLPATDTYRVIATHADPNLAVGAYSLRIEETQLINPPILATAASLTEEDNVIESRRSDIYELQGKAGQALFINMESDEFDTFLRLESETGEVLAVDDDGITGTTNSALNVVLPEDGTYKIIATHYFSEEDYGTEEAIGAYNLQVNEIQYLDPPILQETSARLEEGDNVTEFVNSAYQRFDTYEIQGQTGQMIEVTMESNDFDADLRLENSFGDVLVTNYFVEGQKTVLRAVLPATDTYRVIATHADPNMSVGEYSLRIEETQLISPPILATAASLTEEDNVIESRRSDIYELQGKAGQALFINMESDEFDTFLRLESETGAILAINDDGVVGTTNSALSVVLPEDGTYKIIATHYLPEEDYGTEEVTGSYNLQVNEIQYLEPPILQETSARLEEGDNVTGGSNLYFEASQEYEYIVSDAKQQVSVRVESEDFEDIFLILENSAGQVIEDSQFTENTNELSVELREAGTYKITVIASGEGPGNYNLIIDANPIKDIDVSPDGQQLVTTSSEGTIQRWDLQGNPVGEPFAGHQDEVLSVAFSPDGQQIVSGGSDRTVRLWDLVGTPLGEPFREHGSSVLSVAFSADGERIVSGGEDGTLRLSTLAGNAIGRSFRGHGRDVLSVAFSSDEQSLISLGGDNTVRLWEANVPFRGHQAEVVGVAFSPDGQRIVSSSADKTLRLWDLQGEEIVDPFQGHEDVIISVVFSPDGQQIASASLDGTVRLWDLQGNQISVLQGHNDQVIGVAFRPDGQQIASSSFDSTVRLWDLQGNLEATFRGDNQTDFLFVAFSPDGERIASSGSDGTIRLWNLQGDQIGSAFRGHDDEIGDIAFSPNGQQIVSGSLDRTIRLWDLKGNQIGSSFQGHEDGVFDVAFSPDGERIVSGSWDGTVRLWDLEGNPIGPPLQGHEDGVFGVAFSPDGQRIVHANADGTIQLRWASWKEWLTNSCDRLSHHPRLHGLDDGSDPLYPIASEVREACLQASWNQ